MTDLARPDVRLRRSWAAALQEFGDETAHGSGLWHLERPPAYDEAGCRAVVEELMRYADDTTPLPDDRVHCDYFWITDGAPDDEEVVGFLALRHRLNAWLLEEGGHIGYSVRPSRRREGHAGRALRLALDRARALGLDRVLVTCDEDNVGSRRTIEGVGGAYEDSRHGKRRYWVDTSGSGPAGGR